MTLLTEPSPNDKCVVGWLHKLSASGKHINWTHSLNFNSWCLRMQSYWRWELKDTINLKWSHQGGPWSNTIDVLMKSKQSNTVEPDRALYLDLQAKERLSDWTQPWKTINVYCLGSLICGVCYERYRKLLQREDFFFINQSPSDSTSSFTWTSKRKS